MLLPKGILKGRVLRITSENNMLSEAKTALKRFLGTAEGSRDHFYACFKGYPWRVLRTASEE